MQIELKKGIKIIPFFIQSFLVTAVALVVAIAFLCQFLLKEQTFQKMNIGIVVPDEEENTELAMRFISGMDSVSSICDFLYLSEKEAREQLETGELEAAILLTEDFYDDVNNGVNTPVNILLSADSSANDATFRALIKSAVSMLQTAQAAVYAVDDASAEYPFSMKKSKVEYELSYLYLDYAFHRGNTFTEEELSPLGKIDLTEFYIACGVTVFIGIFGFGFLSLYRSEKKEVSDCLKRIGIGVGISSVIRTFVMAFVLWLILILGYFAGNIGYAKIMGMNPYFVGGQVTGLFLYALAQAAFMHAVFAFFGTSENGGLIYLLLTIFMTLCGGGILPLFAFPAWMQKISVIFPLTYWQNYLVQLMFTRLTGKTIVELFLVILIYMGVGTVALYGKTKR